MKYRILTDEELSSLEKELTAFLIVNGIDGPEWEKINKQDPEKAIQLVEVFSDAVLDLAYTKIQFLEHRSEKSCMVFNVMDDESALISLQLKDGSIHNLSTPESIHRTLVESPSEIQFFRHSKRHQKTRNEEVHLLISQGCVPSVKEFWVSLEAVITN